MIYAIATILDPSQKLSPFRSASWTGDGEQWDQRYLDVMKQIFAYYWDHSPAVKEDVYYPSQLSGFDKARNHSKRRRLSPWNSPATTPDPQFAELRRYLDEECEQELNASACFVSVDCDSNHGEI